MPSFRAQWGRRRITARPTYRRIALAGACLLLLILIGVTLLREPEKSTRPPGMVSRQAPAASLSSWRAPTDFLLNTPGREFLTDVPSIPSRLPVLGPQKGSSS